MKILVLGASGMLGHKVLQVLGHSNECVGTVRPQAADAMRRAGFAASALVTTPGLPQDGPLDELLRSFGPDVVINCIGLVKQDPSGSTPTRAIEINALFPHKVAQQCATHGARMLHVSTDCVFSGADGCYSESSFPDALDLYGRSKLLGEVTYGEHLTLRTSIIGRELASSHGLVEWFLSQRGGDVQGYEAAYFSGLSTLALARLLDDVISRHLELTGLLHVASDRIDKCTLLHLLDEGFHTGTAIHPDPSVRIDRSLDGRAFTESTGLSVPDWSDMVSEMVDDARRFGYQRIRAEEAAE